MTPLPPEAVRTFRFAERDPAQLALFDGLGALYRRRNVMAVDGFAPSLIDCCAMRETCWSGITERASRKSKLMGPPGEDGSIFFPWIGTGYRRGGVCVVGWNLHHRGKDWFPLTADHVIAEKSRKCLETGRRKVWNSPFAYRSMSSACAVRCSLTGGAPRVEPSTTDLVSTFDHVARVQAVKCSPIGSRSNPSAAMNGACPKLFLLDELRILQPRAIVVFGNRARDAALSALRDLDRDGSDGHLRPAEIMDVGDRPRLGGPWTSSDFGTRPMHAGPRLSDCWWRTSPIAH